MNMNRAQRRQAGQGRQGQGQGMVNLRDLVQPQQMTMAECESVLLLRLSSNLRETGHPFHHRTANGAIVTPDPTLDYYFSRLTVSRRRDLREDWQRKIKPDAPAALPVNRSYYGVNPYERN